MADNLLNFAKENPLLEIETINKRGPTSHPFLRGEYVNKNVKTIGIKNLEPDQIHDHVFLLRNQIGRRVSLFISNEFNLFSYRLIDESHSYLTIFSFFY